MTDLKKKIVLFATKHLVKKTVLQMLVGEKRKFQVFANRALTALLTENGD